MFPSCLRGEISSPAVAEFWFTSGMEKSGAWVAAGRGSSGFSPHAASSARHAAATMARTRGRVFPMAVSVAAI